MKRILLLAALCLFAMPAKASVFHLTGGRYEVAGDFSALGAIQGTVGFTFSATELDGSPLIITSVDTGPPYNSYLITVRVNEATRTACFVSQVGSMCGRAIQNQPVFSIFDIDGDGTGFMNVDAVVSANGLKVSNLDIAVNLPDGFVIVGVPEPSTWLMMILGFLGLVIAQRINSSRSPTAAVAGAIGRCRLT